MNPAESTPDTGPKRNFAWGLIKDWGLALVLVAVVIVAWQLFSSSGPGVGEPAPDFTLPTPDGELVTLSDLRGETVVVNFWATWCGPCRSEIPDLTAFQKANPHIVLLGVSVDERKGPAAVAREAARLGAEYQILLDPTGIAATPYSISTLPTTVVIGPDGTVLQTAVGTVSERQLTRMTQL